MKEKDLKKSESKKIIIATYAMASEALDIKSLTTLILATPKTDITQAVGRILRIKHARPMVIDIVDRHDIFKRQWNKRRIFYQKNKYKILYSEDYKNGQWKLIENKKDINDLFDILIDKTSLDDEIRYLIIYKKSLFNADSSSENELLKMLDPIIKSNSIWKSHALYLMAEFFYNKKQNQKAKEFFEKIIVLENSNIDILRETQVRLNRDLSD